MIQSKIIKQTKNSLFNDVLTTYEIVLPKYLFAEVNKHRILGNCASSLRAIPITKLIESVKQNPFIPIYWGKTHKGMHTQEFFEDTTNLIKDYLQHRDSTIELVEMYLKAGVSKQVVNRLLEPFTYSKMVLTGTEWENWFNLRGSKYEVDGKTFDTWQFEEVSDIEKMSKNFGTAEPHFKHLVELMKIEMNNHIPDINKYHIPYFIEELEAYDINSQMEYSASRVARTSYLLIQGDSKSDIEANLKLAQQLKEEKHSVPFEFPQTAMTEEEYFRHSKTYITEKIDEKIEKEKEIGSSKIEVVNKGFLVTEYGWCNQYRGFIPYRKKLKL